VKASPASSSRPSPTASGASTPDPSANPFHQLGVKSSNTGAQSQFKININPADSNRRARGPGSDDVKAPPPKKASTPTEETIEEWENKTLSNIFRITLEEDRRTDAQGHKLIHLPDLRRELAEGNEPVRLNAGNLDQALVEACSKWPHNTPVLDFLLPCWKRTMKALRGLRGYSDGRDGVLKEAKRLCMSNCIFAVTLPDLFGCVSMPQSDGYF
jgi:ubiquitin conjugation factor E4 B